MSIGEYLLSLSTDAVKFSAIEDKAAQELLFNKMPAHTGNVNNVNFFAIGLFYWLS